MDWISVKKRLPAEDELDGGGRVLVWAHWGDPSRAEAHQTYFYQGEFGTVKRVTHWVPLKPPTEELE